MRISPLVVLCSIYANIVWSQTNTWVQLSPTPAARWMPNSAVDCTGTLSTTYPIGRQYSGIGGGGGYIFYFGGGHNGYPGNDVDLFNISLNQWVPDSAQPQCVNSCCGGVGSSTCDNYPVGCIGSYPTCMVGSCQYYVGTGPTKPAFRCSGGANNGLLCDQDSDCSGGACTVGIPTPGSICTTCQPYMGHQYQRAVWNPIRGTFFVYTESGSWEWNPSTRVWTWLGVPPPQVADQSDRLVFWDPIQQRVTYINTGTFGTVQTFSYVTNTWTQLDSYLPFSAEGQASQSREIYGAWDTLVNKFILAANYADSVVTWYTYNPGVTGASAWVNITANAPAAAKTWCGAFPCFQSSMTYDSNNQRTIVMTLTTSGVVALWAYNAVLDNWTLLTTINAPSANATPPYGDYPNHLYWDSNTQLTYYVNTTSLWSSGGGHGQVDTWKIDLQVGPIRRPTPPHFVP